MTKDVNKDVSVFDAGHLQREIQTVEELRNEILNKAIQSGDPDTLVKANEYMLGRIPVKGLSNPKSLLEDPYLFQSAFKYKAKPSQLSYNMLSRMTRVPIISSVIKTRVSQVSRFAEPSESKFNIGFQIVMTDPKAKPNRSDRKNMEEITMAVLNCGFGGYQWGRDDFSNFLKKIIKDSLTYDQMTFEVVDDRKGVPREWFATDAGSYRIASIDDDEQDMIEYYNDVPYKPAYVQLDQNSQVHDYFYPWELCFGVRNPRSDLKTMGYGLAESEDLIDIITSMIWADEYNRRFFSHGSAPKGIIRVSGVTDEEKLREFKREWLAQMAGVYNSWKTPIMHADKMDFIDVQKTNREMEYKAWTEYLIKLVCAIYTISPSEIGFDLRGSSNYNPMFESSQEAQIKYSFDKGLTPLVVWLQNKFNRHIIWRIDPRYSLKFFGVGTEDRYKVLDRVTKEVAFYKTVDEVRAEMDLEPLGEENGGNLVLNAIWYQAYAMNKQMEQANQQQMFQMMMGGGDPNQQGQQDGGQQEQQIEQAVVNPFVKAFNDYAEKELYASQS